VIKSGDGDLHHILEALFKALGKALDQATQIDVRRKGVPSTKGIID
jgi:imidazoleglycerol-phosphate dehydratase